MENPVSPKCERVIEDLEAGKVPCWDFRKIRQASACTAWQLMEERKSPWGESLREAWRIVRGKCTWREGV